jgi:hypothetical protein
MSFERIHFMRALLIVLLLTGAAWAQTPEQLVKNLYQYHLGSPGEVKTVKENRQCFTPGFLQVIDQDQRFVAKGMGANFLTEGNGGWGDFEVHNGYPNGNVYVVPLTLYCGVRSGDVRTDPKLRAEWPLTKVNVLLTDVGYGYQIYDLDYLPRAASKFGAAREGGSARTMLTKNTASVELYLKKQK